MITLEKVTKSFANLPAVNQISLSVNPGEIFGLVGPDGAGKTTTIRMITGVIEPTAGRITVLDQENIERVKAGIGYVPQKFSLYGDLTVIENIRFMGSMYGASRDTIEKKAHEILSFTNLLPFQNRLADNLSGGMKQKLALAAGLMHKPKLFFLDEPTTGVDPVSRREFWQMLYKLNKEGMTIFVSTPYMDEAELCTRLAFMDQGQIISCAAPGILKKSYPHRILELQANGKGIQRSLQHCPIKEINAFGDKYHLVVDDPEAAVPAVKAALFATAIPVISLQEIAPTMEDVFVALANEVAKDERH
jgi:ABC-2 type transport system ATP-binding protein